MKREKAGMGKFVCFSVAVATAFLIAWTFFLTYLLPGGFLRLPDFEKIISKIDEIKTQVITPSPLIGKDDSPSAYLTQAGVLTETNYHRQTEGLVVLKLNEKLNIAATGKMNDLFQKQYFAHESPTGEGPSYWVGKAGYAYIIIGENLALGNFQDDKTLVEAWMNSPGHRANIMNDRYVEIGIAVGRGEYEGRMVWIAVQEFGLPISACPGPDESLKEKINEFDTYLNDLEAQTDLLQRELSDKKLRRNVEVYNQRADAYNAMILEYNSLLEATKELVSQYNAQVREFNACVGE